MVFIESLKWGSMYFSVLLQKAINVDKSKFWQEIYKDQLTKQKTVCPPLSQYTEYCSVQSFDILLLLQNIICTLEKSKISLKIKFYLFLASQDVSCFMFQVSQDVSYQIFATSATFFVPLILILLLYWRIFVAAR